MIKKLTLALNDTTVRRAKRYALKRKLSLSKLVEYYFASLTSDSETSDLVLPPITAELSGLIRGKKVVNEKASVAEAVTSKYL